MSLLPQTPAQIAAAEINHINQEVISYLQSQARRAYDLANTPGEEQNIMDAFGANATQALTVYATIYGALVAIGQAGSIQAPNMERFQPQKDGKVVFVAPEPFVMPEP